MFNAKCQGHTFQIGLKVNSGQNIRQNIYRVYIYKYIYTKENLWLHTWLEQGLDGARVRAQQ